MNGNSVVEKELADFLTRYNQCFYDRDIDALKLLYAPSSSVGFWDNHANCDTYELKEHIKKLSDFFENGKQTETGTVEPLLVENLRASSEDGFAVLTAVLRYQSAPRPGYTATLESGHVSEPGHASLRRTAISFGATYNNQDSQTGRLRLEYSSETGKTKDQNRKT